MRLDHRAASQACKHALLAAAASLAITTAPPALALPPTIEQTVVEATEASYPILKALDQAFPPFTERIGKLLLEVGPKKLGKSIDLGLDVFATVPSDTVNTFTETVKESFKDLKTDSCTLVPLPPKSLADQFKAVATETVDPAKLKAFGSTWGPPINALSKTDSAICLPPVQTLDKLALAQIDVGRKFGYAETKRFFDYTGPMLKGEIRLTDDTMAILTSAKAQASDATTAESLAFQRASKALESASKREKEKATVARVKAEAAEAAAKKKAS